MVPDLASLAVLGGWLYLVAFAATVLDAVLPLVPSETVLIAGGVLAAAGQTNLVGLALAGAAGGVAGDCVAYLLGARLSSGGIGPLLHRRRGLALLRWATLELLRHGPVIIVAARFVPGGRTATTVTAGFLRYPPAAFVGSVLAGGVLWASYATSLGYAGGRAFHANGWTALGAALLAALTVALLAGLARRLFGRPRQPLPEPVPVPGAPPESGAAVGVV